MGTLSNTSVGLGGQALFSSGNRLIGLAGGLYTEPNYARSHFVSRGGNDEILGFYGHRLPHRRDEDAARASFVSFVGAEVQQARLHSGNTREEEEEASAAVSHSNSGSLPLVRRGGGGGGNGQGKAIVAAPAVEQPWSVSILSRSKPSDGEQQQQQQNNEKEDNNNAVTVVDMELLNPRSVGEQQQQQSQMMQLQQHRGMQVEPILMRQRSSSGATIACQDCGNQAKKDCPHMRCRTCCKSRGFDCATHVRSTWVPASKRRERQQAEVAAMVSGQPVPKSKRARTLALAGAAAHMGPQTASYTSTSTGTPPRSSDFNPALLPAHQQEAIFRAALPPEVKAQALFQCVRVTGVSDGQDEYAYKTVVRIGGRIFKGLLHDQGASDKGNAPPPSVAELQLGGRSVPLSSALIDLAGIYGTPGNTLLGGKESIPGPF